jgi:hypothetical protein
LNVISKSLSKGQGEKMTKKHYLKIAAFVAAALLWQGAAPRAGAQEKPKAPPPSWSASYHSSVQVPPSEKDEAKLQAAAKVNAEQVKAAAMELHKGWSVKYVELKNVKGNLVYEVEFKDDKEYFFDAGTGELFAKPAKKK